MAKRPVGLTQRGKTWWIDKRIRGYGSLRESCGTDSLEEASRVLHRRLEEVRQQILYGQRVSHSFAEAAARYLTDFAHLSSNEQAAYLLPPIVKEIGMLPLDKISNDSLRGWRNSRIKEGAARKSINLALEHVRRILNLAANEWHDPNGKTWLERAPKIKMLKKGEGGRESRQPYPLSWEEQDFLFALLPLHLKRAFLFKVNTGLREQEVCALRWEWEIQVAELDARVFIIPAGVVKNGEDRLVVLNSIARAVIEECRGMNLDYVFVYRPKQDTPSLKGTRRPGPGAAARPLASLNTTAWVNARERAAKEYLKRFGRPCPEGFRTLHIHDLKHTFGRRLRAAGVWDKTAKVLLGHSVGDITLHYSAAELGELIDAAERAATLRKSTPTLTFLRAVA